MTDDTKIVPISGKRRPPRAGMGRQAGTPNKTTSSMKAMILQAFEKAGGADWLAKQADENPVAFMGLLSKLLPSDIALSASITNHEPITKVEWEIIEHTPVVGQP